MTKTELNNIPEIIYVRKKIKELMKGHRKDFENPDKKIRLTAYDFSFAAGWSKTKTYKMINCITDKGDPYLPTYEEIFTFIEYVFSVKIFSDISDRKKEELRQKAYDELTEAIEKAEIAIEGDKHKK